MHAIEIIVALNAEAAGISVEQNLAEAVAGQFIRAEVSPVQLDAQGQPVTAVIEKGDGQP